MSKARGRQASRHQGQPSLAAAAASLHTATGATAGAGPAQGPVQSTAHKDAGTVLSSWSSSIWGSVRLVRCCRVHGRVRAWCAFPWGRAGRVGSMAGVLGELQHWLCGCCMDQPHVGWLWPSLHFKCVHDCACCALQQDGSALAASFVGCFRFSIKVGRPSAALTRQLGVGHCGGPCCSLLAVCSTHHRRVSAQLFGMQRRCAWWRDNLRHLASSCAPAQCTCWCEGTWHYSRLALVANQAGCASGSCCCCCCFFNQGVSLGSALSFVPKAIMCVWGQQPIVFLMWQSCPWEAVFFGELWLCIFIWLAAYVYLWWSCTAGHGADLSQRFCWTRVAATQTSVTCRVSCLIERSLHYIDTYNDRLIGTCELKDRGPVEMTSWDQTLTGGLGSCY